MNLTAAIARQILVRSDDERALDILRAATLDELRVMQVAVLEEVSEELAAGGKPITCRGVGCSGCCRGEVAILEEEWTRLEPLVSDDALRRAWDDRGSLLEMVGGANRPESVCPLLEPERGLCGVYEERPMTCIGYHVVTPPDWCDPAKGEGRLVGSHPDPLAFCGAAFVARGELNVVTLGEKLVRLAVDRGLWR